MIVYGGRFESGGISDTELSNHGGNMTIYNAGMDGIRIFNNGLDSDGILQIEDCSITSNDSALCNYGTATINGGTISGSPAIYNCGRNKNAACSIDDGTIIGGIQNSALCITF